MTASILPPPRFVATDPGTGAPLAGGYVYTYVPGTTTPKATWQDEAATLANPNPAVLDSAGSMPLWGTGDYDIVVTDALGNQIAGYSGRTSAGLTGNVTIDGTLGVTGVTNLNDVHIAGNLGVENPASTTTLGGTLDVVGTSNLANVNVSGTLAVPGTSLFGTLNTSGPVTAASLGVIGPANFTGVNVASGILFGPTGSIGSVSGTGGTIAVNCTLNVGANVTVAGVVTAAGTGPGSGTGAWLGADGEHAGGPTWSAPLCFNGTNALAGTGFYTLSDARTKTDIRDVTLDEAARWVRAGRPRRFRDTHGMPTAGFVAQEDMAAGREEAVSAYHDPDPRFAEGTFSGLRLARKSDPDIAYLTKVVVDLMDRLAALEAKMA